MSVLNARTPFIHDIDPQALHIVQSAAAVKRTVDDVGGDEPGEDGSHLATQGSGDGSPLLQWTTFLQPPFKMDGHAICTGAVAILAVRTALLTGMLAHLADFVPCEQEGDGWKDRCNKQPAVSKSSLVRASFDHQSLPC